MRRWRTGCILALAFALGCGGAEHAAGTRDGIGVRVLALTDTSRTLVATGKQRPIQVVLWYPARVDSAAAPMTMRAYYALAGSEDGTAATPARDSTAIAAAISPFRAHGVADSIVDGWLGAPMAAVRDAKGVATKAPLVLIAPGTDEGAADEADLGEYLAGQGFVVAAIPSVTRISGPWVPGERILGRVQEGAADLAFVLRSVASLPGVDTFRVGVVGHSFGARSGLLLGLRDSTIRALASLDGGIGVTAGHDELECSGYFRPQLLRSDILHFSETLDSMMTPDDSLIRELGSVHRWIVPTTGMHHHHFTVLGGLGDRWPLLAQATGSDSQTTRNHQRVLEITAHFLGAELRGVPPVDSLLHESSWTAPFAARALPRDPKYARTRGVCTLIE